MSESGETTLVGIDIGGTNTRLAIVDIHGRVLADRSEPTPVEADGSELVRLLLELYTACREETDSYPAPEVIGVAVPGVLEPGRSAVVRAVNLPNLEGLPLRDRLIEVTGVRTVLESDAVAAAWAEYCAGERAAERMGYLAIGTGIGGAVILEGAIVRHTSHTAGHLGHIVCDFSATAPLCECGGYGCLESVLSGPALNRAARANGFDGGIGDVEVAYHEGDGRAAEFIREKSAWLCGGLVTLIHIYKTERIVIGGGAAGALPSLVHGAAEMISNIRTALMPATIRVDLGSLGDCAGVVGAAILAYDSS